MSTLSTDGKDRVWWPWVVIAVVVVIVVTGAVLGIISWVGGHHVSAAKQQARSGAPRMSVAAVASVQQQEDAIAARPMLQVEQNFLPQGEVNASTPSMVLPASTKTVAGVASGFPRTPAGAVAQLAAMDQGAYSNFSPDTARAVYTAYALPGAVSITQWEPTSTIFSFYQANPKDLPSVMQASFLPVQGLIKGSADDGNFVVACVSGRLSYSYQGDAAQVGVPDCSRMAWHSGQWVLAPGSKPAMPPVLWPRNAQSYQAGFRDLVQSGS